MVCFVNVHGHLKKNVCSAALGSRVIYVHLDAGGRLCCSYSIHADFLSRRWEVGAKVPNHSVDLFIPPSALPVCASSILTVCCFLCSHLGL